MRGTLDDTVKECPVLHAIDILFAGHCMLWELLLLTRTEVLHNITFSYLLH